MSGSSPVFDADLKVKYTQNLDRNLRWHLGMYLQIGSTFKAVWLSLKDQITMDHLGI